MKARRRAYLKEIIALKATLNTTYFFNFLYEI